MWLWPGAEGRLPLRVNSLRKTLAPGTSTGEQRCSNIPVPRGSNEGREWWEMRMKKPAFEGPCLASQEAWKSP